ncbi:MAG: hypothetical protein WBA57_06110 [Elainellaceae cyanobacterium]
MSSEQAIRNKQLNEKEYAYTHSESTVEEDVLEERAIGAMPRQAIAPG